MKTLVLACLATAALASAACGGSTQTETPTVDASTPHHDASHAADGHPADGPAPGSVVGPCGAGGSCPANATCYFPLGSCTATGQCIENPAPGSPVCRSEELVCGCGTTERTGCGVPSGYATGPALGSDCGMPTSSSTATSASSVGSSSVVTGSSVSASSVTSVTGSSVTGSSATSSTVTSVTGNAGCPLSMPAAGDFCGITFDCEYGSDPDVRCDTVFTCTDHAWQVSQSPSTTDCGTTNAPSCPATYAAVVAEGGMCPIAMSGTTCDYPEARCSCGQSCGMLGVGDGAIWCCPDAPPEETGCPDPRPRLGTPCGSTMSVCDYGGCSGNVEEQCLDGVWQKDTMFGCPG